MADEGALLVPEGYLRYLVSLANAKMGANWARMRRFHSLFRQRFLGVDVAPAQAATPAAGAAKQCALRLPVTKPSGQLPSSGGTLHGSEADARSGVCGQNGSVQDSNGSLAADTTSMAVPISSSSEEDVPGWAVVVRRERAAAVKDALKGLRYLDDSRRSGACDGGGRIALPVTHACAEALRQRSALPAEHPPSAGKQCRQPTLHPPNGCSGSAPAAHEHAGTACNGCAAPAEGAGRSRRTAQKAAQAARRSAAAAAESAGHLSGDLHAEVAAGRATLQRLALPPATPGHPGPAQALRAEMRALLAQHGVLSCPDVLYCVPHLNYLLHCTSTHARAAMLCRCLTPSCHKYTKHHLSCRLARLFVHLP